jgi:rfaE bifunctional protein nucleotidyltransferase chain/domain
MIFDNAIDLANWNWFRGSQNVVFTNGCFDILHVGHVRLLQYARLLGSALVVGVNDDESVRRLKGSHRPVTPLGERTYMLDALKCVTYVIPFSEDTPLELIKTIRPSILVKGGDYADQDIVGRDLVEHVVLFPTISNTSTTKIIEKFSL